MRVGFWLIVHTVDMYISVPFQHFSLRSENKNRIRRLFLSEIFMKKLNYNKKLYECRMKILKMYFLIILIKVKLDYGQGQSVCLKL